MSSNAVHARSTAYATLAAVIIALSVVPGKSATLLEPIQHQVPAPGVNVEESNIKKYSCNGQGENGGQIYVYVYLQRPGVRVISPPNWSTALGGRDFASEQEANNVLTQACSSFCGGKINPNLSGVAVAKNAMDTSYNRWMVSGQKDVGAYNDYMCARQILTYWEGVARSGN